MLSRTMEEEMPVNQIAKLLRYLAPKVEIKGRGGN